MFIIPDIGSRITVGAAGQKLYVNCITLWDKELHGVQIRWRNRAYCGIGGYLVTWKKSKQKMLYARILEIIKVLDLYNERV